MRRRLVPTLLDLFGRPSDEERDWVEPESDEAADQWDARLWKPVGGESS